MLKIAICDDNAEQLKKIKTETEQYFDLHSDWEIELETFSNSMLLLDSLESNGSYDIVLLDICMPGVLGTDVAGEIRRRRDKTEIIFLTSSDEYAVDAFLLKAAHYLIKPFSKERFTEAMDRAMDRFSSGDLKNIIIKSETGELYNIKTDDIIYIEGSGHSLTVYTKEQNISEARRSINRLLEELEKLSPRQFVSPYKGYIVNQKAILTIKKDIMILKGNIKIPIPKRGYKELQNQYMDYLFEDKSKGENK